MHRQQHQLQRRPQHQGQWLAPRPVQPLAATQALQLAVQQLVALLLVALLLVALQLVALQLAAPL